MKFSDVTVMIILKDKQQSCRASESFHAVLRRYCSRAAESESEPESESVGVGCLPRSRSRESESTKFTDSDRLRAICHSRFAEIAKRPCRISIDASWYEHIVSNFTSLYHSNLKLLKMGFDLRWPLTFQKFSGQSNTQAITIGLLNTSIVK